jgi:RNA polymerase sigma factor (TIGR02999 family)
MAKTPQGEVTRLLMQWSDGKVGAYDDLFSVLHRELRQMAEAIMKSERDDHTLQPTALVNEAYLRLVGPVDVQWQGRSQFLAIAAKVMRRILVDYARRRLAGKRISSAGKPVSLQDIDEPYVTANENLIALDVALTKLAELDPRQAKVVELRFFGGLSVTETAEELDVSEATVKREWRMARLWLRRELRGRTGKD